MSALDEKAEWNLWQGLSGSRSSQYIVHTAEFYSKTCHLQQDPVTVQKVIPAVLLGLNRSQVLGHGT